MNSESTKANPEKIGEKIRKLVSRDQIRTAMALPKKDIYIPQWEGYITVQGFTMKQAETAKNAAKVEGENGQTVIDEDLLNRQMLKLGVVQPALTSADVDMMFDTLPSSMISHIVNELQKLNNQEGEAIRKAQDAFRAVLRD